MKVLVILAICCFQTARSINSVVIGGHLGEKLDLKFPPNEMKEEYNKLIQTKNIQSQDLQRDLKIGFTKMNSTEEVTVFMDGKTMNQWASSKTGTFIDHDSLMVKISKLEMKDVGIYKIYFGTDYFGQICLSVTGKPKITGRDTPNPVLKPGHNQTTTTLACPSVSTSIGDCQMASSLKIIWYKNGLRIKEIGPTSFEIKVTVDQNGGNFTCLVIDYIPCDEKLQTTNHYNEVMNIKECNRVTEKETYFIKPEYKTDKTVPEVSEDVNVWHIIVAVIIIAVIAGIAVTIFCYCYRGKNKNYNKDKEQGIELMDH